MTKKSARRRAKIDAGRRTEQFISDDELNKATLAYLRETKYPDLTDDQIVKEAAQLTPDEWKEIGRQVFARTVAGRITKPA